MRPGQRQCALAHTRGARYHGEQAGNAFALGQHPIERGELALAADESGRGRGKLGGDRAFDAEPGFRSAMRVAQGGVVAEQPLVEFA